MITHLDGKAVLVTGGTMGIGLATGLAFGRVGAHVYLTYKWGSSDEEDVRRAFAATDAPEPCLVQADVAIEDDTVELLRLIKKRHDRLEAFISNVAFAQTVRGIDDYNKKGLFKSLEYSAWPFVGYLQQIKQTFGAWPRYAIGVSSEGVEQTAYPGYGMVAVAKVVMEVMCRYLSARLFEEDIRLNIIRPIRVSTDSFRATVGDEMEPFLRRIGGDRYFLTPDEVGDAILALCSGLMDAVSGQVILLDRGGCFCDSLVGLFEKREKLGS